VFSYSSECRWWYSTICTWGKATRKCWHCLDSILIIA